jgi:EAL domain-containing protein (putative c-di-GMP-specific phosphodiesterase class I)
MVKGAAVSGSDPTGRFSPERVSVALEAGEFVLLYQPTMDLHTNGFSGVEALVRWRQPEGLLGPDAFLAEMQESGAVVELGHWTLLAACFQGALWHARGYRILVAVNIAARHFARDGFVTEVEAVLRRTRFDPHLLSLELSSLVVLDDPHSPGRLAALNDLGVVTAVDDVGLDAPLADLAAQGVRMAKLSRTAVAAVGDSPDTAEALARLVEAARASGVRLVASGIEDIAQRGLLEGAVGLGQGYLFSRPHEAAEIDRLLEDYALFSGDPL